MTKKTKIWIAVSIIIVVLLYMMLDSLSNTRDTNVIKLKALVQQQRDLDLRRAELNVKACGRVTPDCTEDAIMLYTFTKGLTN